MGKASFEIVILDSKNNIITNYEDAVTTIEAGTHLKGYILLNVEKEISGTEMNLTLTGLESTRVDYTVTTGTGDKQRTEHRHAFGSRNIIQVTIPLDNTSFIIQQQQQATNGIAPHSSISSNAATKHSIPIGKYKTPFDIELPPTLPSSMDETNYNGYCRISYKLIAVLEGSGMVWNYQGDRIVTIRAAKLDLHPVPFNKEPYTEQVTSCCCFNRGSISFGAMVTDTRLNRGEITRVSMSCRNHTRVQIQSINVILSQYIRWSAGGHNTSSSYELVKLNFGYFQGLDRMIETSTNNGQQDRKIGIASQQDLQDIFHEMKQGIHIKDIQVPSNARNSYSGSLITITHKLEVIVQIGCCITNPTITIPVEIGELLDGTPTTPTLEMTTPQQDTPSIPVTNTDTSTTLASTIYIPSSHNLTGGASHITEEEVAVTPPLMIDTLQPSFENLLKAMNESIDDASLIETLASDSTWKGVFNSLTPNNYRDILKAVDSDFDETRVAIAVAQHIGLPNFTCAYIVAILQFVSEWNRANIIEKLIPYCNDIRTNSEQIITKLSEWEKLVTKVAFENALK